MLPERERILADILTLYCEPWETPLRTSKHHYLSRLAAAGHRVLYVEIPYNPLGILRRPQDFVRDAIPRLRAGVRQVVPNIWAMTGVFPLPFHRGLGGVFDNSWLNAANQQAFLPRLRKGLRQLEFGRPIVLSYYPLALPILEKLNPRRVVFHMVDEWQGLAGIPHSMAELTAGMLRRADVTVVTSRVLLERYQSKARDIHLLRHGTDLSLFSPVYTGLVAADSRVTSLPGIKVGYYGALHKLDYGLIREVVSQRPNWSFVFLGPLQGRQGLNSAPAAQAGNVHFWDAWPWQELPGFLAGLDVCWMPFMRNELTHAMCPIKLFEVLSAGNPVVSTDLHETRDVGGEVVSYAADSKGHLAALDRCVEDKARDAREARAERVAQYDWSMRLEVFTELLLGTDGGLAKNLRT